MPVYNGADYLPAALESIAIQADSGIEVIAVDDQSTDSSLAILESFRGKFFLKIIRHARTGSWVASTNEAIQQAEGNYLCTLHQDDLWFPPRLEQIRNLIDRHPATNLFLHPVQFINASGKIRGNWHCPLPINAFVTSDLMIERLLVQNFISIVAPIFKREAALQVGSFDDELWYTADWDFWLKMARLGRIYYHPVPLAAFRIHRESQTVARSPDLVEFRGQLESVFLRHYNAWQYASRVKTQVQLAAQMSIEWNVALVALAHGSVGPLKQAVLKSLHSPPATWRRFLRDSRILERAYPRWRVFL